MHQIYPPQICGFPRSTKSRINTRSNIWGRNRIEGGKRAKINGEVQEKAGSPSLENVWDLNWKWCKLVYINFGASFIHLNPKSQNKIFDRLRRCYRSMGLHGERKIFSRKGIHLYGNICNYLFGHIYSNFLGSKMATLCLGPQLWARWAHSYATENMSISGILCISSWATEIFLLGKMP